MQKIPQTFFVVTILSTYNYLYFVARKAPCKTFQKKDANASEFEPQLLLNTIKLEQTGKINQKKISAIKLLVETYIDNGFCI